MEKYMNSGIKNVISEFPEVGRILEEFGVGCVTCNLGSCLMKDIIGIHNLSKKEEATLMARIEKAIYPEREVKIEYIPEEEKKEKANITYSEPVEQLVLEHDQIKILLGNIPKICEILKSPGGFDRGLVVECVEFIRNYADRFHHSKEEDILFKFVDENSEIIKSMLEDHKLARWFVKSIITGAEKQNVEMVIKNLTSYGELLAEHIRKEDEILYPFIDRRISEFQLEVLNNKFTAVNQEFGNGFKEKWGSFLEKIENLI